MWVCRNDHMSSLLSRHVPTYSTHTQHHVVNVLPIKTNDTGLQVECSLHPTMLYRSVESFYQLHYTVTAH